MELLVSRISRAVVFAVILSGCQNQKMGPDVTTSASAPASNGRVASNHASATASAPASAALPPTGSSPIVAIGMGNYRHCAVRADGRVVCWGDCPTCGWVQPEPSLVLGLEDAIAVEGRDEEFCALKKDGAVACWQGTKPAQPIAGVSGAVGIAGPCAVLGTGKVRCWSEDHKAVDVAGLANVKSLGGGDGGRCAIHQGGAISCWGGSMSHFLDTPPGQSETPVAIRGVPSADEVETGLFMGACARKDGAIVCWGGRNVDLPHAPKPLAGLKNVVEFAMAEYTGCARLADGRVSCWGSNASGQLGHRHREETPNAATFVPGVADAVAIAVGGGEPCGGCGSACAVTKPGAVVCWGAAGVKETGALQRIDLTPHPIRSEPDARDEPH
jgi:hypothetical protein